jgi:membrane-bound metal-dependent hydrolase YbcI (DUF457 family)
MVASALHLLSGIALSPFVKNNQVKISLVLGSYIPDFDILLIPYLEPAIRAHRTFTHSLYLIAILLFLFKITKKKYFLGFALGVSLHIALDIPFGGGVYLLYPLLEYPFGFNFSHLFLTSLLADIIYSLVIVYLLFSFSIFYYKDKIIYNLIITILFSIILYASLIVGITPGPIPFILLPLICYWYRSVIYRWNLRAV